MNDVVEYTVERKKIAIRLLYTLLFVVVLEILKLIIQVSVLFQYVYLFITKKQSEPVRMFSNKVISYAYRIMRYVCLAENQLPYPFGDFPKEIEPPEPTARFK